MSRLDTGLHLHARVARMDRHPPSKRTRRRFESCRERHGHVAQPEEHPGPNGKRAGSSPAVIANSESEREGSRAPPAKRLVPKGMGIVRSALRQAGIVVWETASGFQPDDVGSIPTARTKCTVRLLARIALFQSVEAGSIPARCTNHSRFVQWQDASL